MALDRLYRGHCAHGSWWLLLDGTAALESAALGLCPTGCVVFLHSDEPPPPRPSPRPD